MPVHRWTWLPPGPRKQLGYLSHRLQIALLGRVFKWVPLRTPFAFTGPGSSLTLVRTMADAGYSRVLVVSDPGLVKAGLVAPLLAALGQCGVHAALFDGIDPDPPLQNVRDGMAAARRHGAEALLAVGGGSALDGAKIIAAALGNDCDPHQLNGYFKLRKPMLPLYVVPTTAGTGSEVTLAAVISNPEAATKDAFADPRLVPHYMALDPDLHLSVPPAITAAVGMDALTHAVESYFSLLSNPDSRRLATMAIRLVFRHLETCCRRGDDRQAREAMMYAATFAGQAFSQTSVGYVHAYAHQFGALYHEPHGRANAIVLPHVLDFYLASGSLSEELKAVAVAIGRALPADDAC